MDKWYEIVKHMEDDSYDEVGDEYRYKTRLLVNQIFRELSGARIKEKGKFKQRMGPEFEQWSLRLEGEYSKDLVMDVLNNDEFWIETLKLSHGI
jgi:hypothetical protein